jgi:hypothetical protein
MLMNRFGREEAPLTPMLVRVRDLISCVLLLSPIAAFAQGNYETQVYGSDTVAAGQTMIELHSNLTVSGFKTSVFGVLPDEHQVHETVEITQGWNGWFETGFYIFTSAGPGQGYKWVGDHIRPRVRAPESWGWVDSICASILPSSGPFTGPAFMKGWAFHPASSWPMASRKGLAPVLSITGPTGPLQDSIRSTCNSISSFR